MPIEITMLLCTAGLAMVQIFLPLPGKVRAYGVAWSTGARDEALPPPGVWAQRLERAHRNLLETLPIFVALVLVGAVTGRFSARTALWAQVYFWARVAYIPSYVLGIRYLRSILWGASFAALLCLLIRISLHG